MKKFFISLALMLSLGFVTMPMYASAALFDGAKDAACDGASLGSSCDADSGEKGDNLIATGLNIFSIVIGIIAVVMIMIGGIKYITSQGDAAQTNTAKNTILYAAIGLAIAALSQVIVQYVIGRFSV